MNKLRHMLNNLSQQERRNLYQTLSMANIAYSNTGNVKQAQKVFKKEKVAAKGKLKKLYAAFQKSENIDHALNVHFDVMT